MSLRIIRWSVLLAMVLALGIPAYSAIAATAAPDGLFELSSTRTKAYTGVVEDGDLLFVSQYSVAYTTVPSDNIDKTFLVNVKDSGGTTFGTNTIYPYRTGGYGIGALSIYLSKAQVDVASLGTYPYTGVSMEIVGNPLKFTSVPSTTYSLATTDYSTPASDSLTDLRNDVIQIAKSLETDWSVTLLTDANLINNADGETYFLGAIPGLRTMIPTAFVLASEPVIIPTPAPTIGAPGTLAQVSTDRFDTTFYLTPALDSMGNTLGLPNGAFQGILGFVLIALVSYWGLRYGGSQGALMGFSVGIMVVIPLFMFAGWISWAYGVIALATIAIVAVFKFAREWMTS